MQADETPSASFVTGRGGIILVEVNMRRRSFNSNSTGPDLVANKAGVHTRGSAYDSAVESNSCTQASDAKEKKEARKTQTQTGASADIPSSPSSPPSPRATVFTRFFRSTGPSAVKNSQANHERSQGCRGVLTSLIRVLSSSVAFLVVVFVSTNYFLHYGAFLCVGPFQISGLAGITDMAGSSRQTSNKTSLKIWMNHYCRAKCYR